MTDQELIKRDDALKECTKYLFPDEIAEGISCLPAIDPADTVKDLMKLRDYWMKDSAAAWDECEVRRLEAVATQAKLTKAMAALRGILKGDDMYPWRIAREALAKLEAK